MLHAELNPYARERLAKMRRNATISSFVIAILSVALLLLFLSLFLLKPSFLETNVIVSYTREMIDEDPIDKKIIRPNLQQKPSAPSPTNTRLLSVNHVSNFAIPTPDIDVIAPSTEIGVNDDFGAGWNKMGEDPGFSGVGSFGSNAPDAKGLKGVLVDFKKKPSGMPVKDYEIKNPNHFIEPMLRLQRANFSSAALRRHFQAERQLVLNHLAVGYADADAGPKNFGAEKEIMPSGWLAHYSSVVTVQRSGTYRFHGHGDDYLAVYINGKAHLHAHWPDIQSRLAGNWAGSATSYKGPFNAHMMVGEWISLKEGDRFEIAIAIGERPGGKVGFVLQIEEKGQSYKNDTFGRPILPLFQLAPMSENEKSRIIKEFGNYSFEWDHVPYFPLAH